MCYTDRRGQRCYTDRRAEVRGVTQIERSEVVRGFI